MLGTVEVKLAHTKRALHLAAELMTKAGYSPTEKDEGRVKWTSQKDSTHTCEIFFQIFRGLCFLGYIRVFACECEERWAFREIVRTFQRELSLRGWGVTREYRIFHSVGIG